MKIMSDCQKDFFLIEGSDFQLKTLINYPKFNL